MSTTKSALSKTPVFFISHGGPNLLEDQAKPGHFYNWLGNYLKNELKPKAIVLISAHWQGEGRNKVFVDVSEKPKLIYDFYNFPKHFYDVTWDHKGSPTLANRVIDLLNKSGVKAEGTEYGNDHGVWVPLKRAMKSNPDIAIVEVSTFAHENMDMHAKMGEALAPLRDEDVVIIGSGSAVHNLRGLWSFAGKPTPKFAIDFESSLEKIATQYKGEERIEKANELDQHPSFRDCHPTAEHLMPFHVALGAAGADNGKRLLEDYFATIGWGSYAFGLPEDTPLPKYPATPASL